MKSQWVCFFMDFGEDNHLYVEAEVTLGEAAHVGGSLEHDTPATADEVDVTKCILVDTDKQPIGRCVNLNPKNIAVWTDHKSGPRKNTSSGVWLQTMIESRAIEEAWAVNTQDDGV